MCSVILRSSDGADHVVSQEAASLSKTVQSLLEELEGESAKRLCLSNTDSTKIWYIDHEIH